MTGLRWGLIARGENRGLGHICWEVYRNLRPTATLAVDMGQWARGFRPNRHWYPDATWVTFDGNSHQPLDMDVIDAWMIDNQLDVIYSAETFYDWRIVSHARRAGIRTVLHTMPEFHRRPECDTVDVTWLPTTWRQDHHPGAPIVPIPVDLARPWDRRLGAHDGPRLKVLHIAGHRAHMDRNGTLILCEALRSVRQPVHVTIQTQDRDCPVPQDTPRNVLVEVVRQPLVDYWEMYGDQHVMALPRRYGGLSLPVNEAMAAGLGVIMPGIPPNSATWPVWAIQAGRGASFESPAGAIPTGNADPAMLADALDRMAIDRAIVEDLHLEADAWAHEHSWANLAGVWADALAQAATQ